MLWGKVTLHSVVMTVLRGLTRVKKGGVLFIHIATGVILLTEMVWLELEPHSEGYVTMHHT